MYVQRLSLSPMFRTKVARLEVAGVVDVVFRCWRGRNATTCRKCAFGVAEEIVYV